MEGICLSPVVVILVLLGAIAWSRALLLHRRDPDGPAMRDRRTGIEAASLAAVLAGSVALVVLGPQLFPNAVTVAFLAALVAAALNWLAGAIVVRPDGSGRPRAALYAAAVAALLACVFLAWHTSTTHRTAVIVRDGRLAPLPESATGVRAYSWAAGFGGASYLKFTAAPGDIDAFIASSPSLKFVKPVLPSAPDEEFDEKHIETEALCRRFSRVPYEVEWFKPAFNGTARGYEIPTERNVNGGYIVVNPDTNTVYICVIWG